MYKQLDNFPKRFYPCDNDIIWKYMTFDKFVNLLLFDNLYLPRADLNPIYFEGQLNEENKKILGEYYKNTNVVVDNIINAFNKNKTCTYIDSWHKNQYESFAMWKIFGGNNNAVSIKSTVGNLKKIYNNKGKEYDCYIVEIDYYKPNESIDFINSELMFMRKPIFFDYENEIRGVIQWKADYYNENIEYPKNESVPILGLNNLIQEIVISPYADEWLYGAL